MLNWLSSAREAATCDAKAAAEAHDAALQVLAANQTGGEVGVAPDGTVDGAATAALGLARSAGENADEAELALATEVRRRAVAQKEAVVTAAVTAKNAAAETVSQRLLFCGREEGKLLALRGIVKEGLTPPVLIFVQSKERAMQLFHSL